jgi:hypothetical protein
MLLWFESIYECNFHDQSNYIHDWTFRHLPDQVDKKLPTLKLNWLPRRNNAKLLQSVLYIRSIYAGENWQLFGSRLTGIKSRLIHEYYKYIVLNIVNLYSMWLTEGANRVPGIIAHATNRKSVVWIFVIEIPTLQNSPGLVPCQSIF